MNNIELLIAKILVKILDVLTCRLNSRENKITYISYTSNKLPQNMKLISENIKKLDKKYEEIYLTIKYKNTIYDKFRYVIEIVKQIYHIKTSKVVIIDGNNFVISNIDKKDTKVIQIWHACGAIKKFGKDFTRKYDIKNYDYIITSSTKSKAIMASAFGMKEEQILTLGCARTDILFKKKKIDRYKEEMYTKYPQFKGKKIVLYAPTFRGDPINDVFYQPINLDYIREQLGDEYVVIYKLHPWLQDRELSKDNNIINGNSDGIRKLFAITDFLICDYSAVIFDFSILGKPMVFFAPDLEEYKRERGMYEEYEEIMPGPICRTEDEVIESIKNNKFNLSDINEFKNKYFDYQDGMSTERVSNFIKSLL